MQKTTLLDICKGLNRHEFIFHYQPLVSLVTGRISGAEALIRWRAPDGSLRMPATFIPLAVEKDFITEITREMLPRLLEDLSQMSGQDDPFAVYLNLSGKDLEDETLIGEIGALLEAKGIPIRRLGIEIVEGVLMPPNLKVRNAIFEIAKIGLPLVLNDFSAGNTTLNYLSQLPLTAIKLSMNIVQRAPLSRMDFRVLRHLISMGHQLRLDVVAEGIETEELYQLILSTGCSAAQGYHFYHPLPLPEFLEVLQKQPRWVNYPFGMEYLAQIDHIDFRRDVVREALIIYSHQDEDIRRRATERLPLLAHDRCLLGEWYYGVGQEWSNAPGFEELGAVHQEFHAVSSALIQAALQGEDQARIMEKVKLLEQLSLQITERVHQYAFDGLLQHYQIHP